MIQPAPSHTAWSPPAPAWVPMAPGVRWKLRPPTGEEQALAAGQVGVSMRRLFEGRAVLESIGFAAEEMGVTGDLERLNGLSGVFMAAHLARCCLSEWEGMDDPESGEPLEITPETIQHALIFGPPPWGKPLTTPFLAWLESTSNSMGGETMRLRRRARDGWAGGFDRCAACADEASDCSKGGSEGGEICPLRQFAPRTVEGDRAWEVSLTPGLWQRAGMEGAVTGLDYGAALLAAEALGSGVSVGNLFSAFRAIEAGRLEAEAHRRNLSPDL